MTSTLRGMAIVGIVVSLALLATCALIPTPWGFG
jgi:hypothetical protein